MDNSGRGNAKAIMLSIRVYPRKDPKSPRRPAPLLTRRSLELRRIGMVLWEQSTKGPANGETASKHLALDANEKMLPSVLRLIKRTSIA